MTPWMKSTGRRPVITFVIAAALLVASVIGSFMHASGHTHRPGAPHTHSAVHASSFVGDSHTIETGAAVDPVDNTSNGWGQGHHIGHADCCDFACNGGIAILAASPVLSTASALFEYHPSASMQPAYRTFGLDRPPQLS